MADKKIGGKHSKPVEPKAKKERKPRKKVQLKLDNKQKRIVAVVVLLFLILMLTYGRKIIKLQIENKQLKTQQEELNSEKNAKTKELKNIHSEDYIKDQARKKLRLLNEDEKIFIFKGESEDEEN